MEQIIIVWAVEVHSEDKWEEESRYFTLVGAKESIQSKSSDGQLRRLQYIQVEKGSMYEY